MKKIVFCVMLAVMTLGASAQKKEVHILSVNDVHAAMECFPRLGYVADSLRALYPELMVLSAGDNRSGDPLNDMYEIPAYPMVALMNQVGFHATTLGNHEFDSGQQGLARLISMSAFPTLCCNIFPDPALGINVRPWKKYDVNGLTVGVIGVVQIGKLGIPESHPKNMVGIKFTDPLETVKKYEFLRKECDVVILLSHLGYEDDVKVSKNLPWVDVIIGGHSHTQLKGGEMHNGILITQNLNRLARATHIVLTTENGKVTAKTAENIAIRGGKNENKVIAGMVKGFTDDPSFKRELAVVDTPFETWEELGCLMADAYVAECGADLSFQNSGGVRYDSHAVGGFTVADVLRLDPFMNDAVEVEATGEELAEMLVTCYDNDNNRFPYVGGMTAEYTIDEKTQKVVKVVLYGLDGKKLNMKKKYKVVSNSYSIAISPTKRADEGRSLGVVTSQVLMNYLEHKGHVSYQGRRCLKEIRK